MTVLDGLKPQKLFPVPCSLSSLKDFFSRPYLVRFSQIEVYLDNLIFLQKAHLFLLDGPSLDNVDSQVFLRSTYTQRSSLAFFPLFTP
jgi:hypothetical protein